MNNTTNQPELLRPVRETERIVSLDVLRGVAVLGILVMNIQSFSMIDEAYMNPSAYGDLTGINFYVWLVCHVLADQKFMTIFSMLFGAGVVLMTERAEAKGRDSAGVHYRRMGWLILFGLLHGHLLWYGDILYAYGMCGLALWLFRKLSPPILIILGIVGIGISSGISLFFGATMSMWADENFIAQWDPPQEDIDEELSTYRGGWIDQMAHRTPTAIFFETFMLFMVLGPRAGGCMLLGMALYKLGFFSALRSYATYWLFISIAVIFAIPVILFGAYRNIESEWDVFYSFFLGGQFNYWASILVSLGWVSVVMILCKSGVLSWLTGLLTSVGRMALSCYLLETIIATTIFYGHGFGYFGHVERIEQLGITFGIWLVLIVFSIVWLRFFVFGPFEWLWRSLTYWKLQPIKRISA